MALDNLPITKSQVEEIVNKVIKKERELRRREQIGCWRSHPHENMDRECEILTEIARLNAELRAPW